MKVMTANMLLKTVLFSILVGSSTTTPLPMPTAPPGAQLPLTVTSTVISLNYDILYEDLSGSRRRPLAAEPLKSLLYRSDTNQVDLAERLSEAYQNTSGFTDLVLSQVPDDNCRGNAEYTVNFDSNRLTSDCQDYGCKLKDQLKEIITKIQDIGNYGTCTVDKNETQSRMEEEIDKPEVSAVLGNPCLMREHRCAPLGVQYTCQYDEPALYCINVCMEGFCEGGECHAEHLPDNNGYDGKAKCSCGDFHFLHNNKCYTWFLVMGPLIGVTAIAVILTVTFFICFRKRKDKGSELTQMTNLEKKNSAKRRTSEPYKDSLVHKYQDVGWVEDAPQTFSNPSFRHGTDTLESRDLHEPSYQGSRDLHQPYYQSIIPLDEHCWSQEDLHQYAQLSADDLAQKAEEEGFQPQLKQIDIPSLASSLYEEVTF